MVEYKFKDPDSPIYPTKVGARLAHARESAGKSKSDICRDLGIDKSAYTKYEKGDRGLPTHTAYDIAKYLHIDLNFLLAGDDRSLSLDTARRLKIA